MSQKIKWTQEFRGLWKSINRDDIQRRTALAIVLGIIERSDESSLWRAEEWLSDIQNKIIESKQVLPESIEIEAHQLDCGLQIFDSERNPENIVAYFGVVQSIKEGVVDILFYTQETTENPKDPILEGVEVSVVDLPVAYARPGVWIAWVERQYKFGKTFLSKGRFEPASSLPQ